jgi:hypothetical protein
MRLREYSLRIPQENVLLRIRRAAVFAHGIRAWRHARDTPIRLREDKSE